jgi:hypothetical protein
MQDDPASTRDALDTLAHGMIAQLDSTERIEAKVSALEYVLKKLSSVTQVRRASPEGIHVQGDGLGWQFGNHSSQTINIGSSARKNKR